MEKLILVDNPTRVRDLGEWILEARINQFCNSTKQLINSIHSRDNREISK